MARNKNLVGRLFFAFFLISLFISVFFIGCERGCKKDAGLTPYISELRSDIYVGTCEDYEIKAYYGYREEPYIADGNVDEKIYNLTFIIKDKGADSVSRQIRFEYEQKVYNETFKYSPITETPTACFEIENFALKEFEVKISSGSIITTVTFKSILPENTLSVESALSQFCLRQPELKNGYTDKDGNFTAEIYARILIKEQKPYWYLGFVSKEKKLKALLIDGFTGEVLAIRDIF